MPRIIQMSHGEDGSIAVEAALIIPVLIVVIFASYNAGGMVFSNNRSVSTFSSISNTLTSVPGDIECSFLDQLSLQAHRMYSEGNWGDTGTGEFGGTGAENFQFEIFGITMQDMSEPGVVTTDDLQGRIDWVYQRVDGSRATGDAVSLVGMLIDIPEELRVPGEMYIATSGYHFRNPPLMGGRFVTASWRRNTYYRSPRTAMTIQLLPPYSSNCQGTSP